MPKKRNLTPEQQERAKRDLLKTFGSKKSDPPKGLHYGGGGSAERHTAIMKDLVAKERAKKENRPKSIPKPSFEKQRSPGEMSEEDIAKENERFKKTRKLIKPRGF